MLDNAWAHITTLMARVIAIQYCRVYYSDYNINQRTNTIGDVEMQLEYRRFT